MSADWTPPGPLKYAAIELRARQYGDPVKKLAYLQRIVKKRSLKRQLRSLWYSVPLLLVLLFGVTRVQTGTDVNAGLPKGKPTAAKIDLRERIHSAPLGPAWLVEHGRDYDVYSNGLRIENRFLTPNETRSYVIFRNGSPSALQSKPAGIIFHTSESVQAPFVSDQNDTLARIGRELVQYVSRHKSYHFVVDRFGRVFRIVPETDVANHSGNSVWADRNGVYVNLNHSFLSISFEAQTRVMDHGTYLSATQIHSGRLLVEMLVHKYQIPLENCVTHAQVSVDPQKMTIGYHYDGSGDFPFQQLGLPDNYALPIPSLTVFGFDFDSRFLMYSGTRLWKGMRLSEKSFRQDAKDQHLSIEQHKINLRKKYWTSIETLKTLGILKEN
jgi:hypothetical protein